MVVQYKHKRYFVYEERFNTNKFCMDCQAVKLVCIKGFVIRQNKSEKFSDFTLFDEGSE